MIKWGFFVARRGEKGMAKKLKAPPKGFFFSYRKNQGDINQALQSAGLDFNQSPIYETQEAMRPIIWAVNPGLHGCRIPW